MNGICQSDGWYAAYIGAQTGSVFLSRVCLWSAIANLHGLDIANPEAYCKAFVTVDGNLSVVDVSDSDFLGFVYLPKETAQYIKNVDGPFFDAMTTKDARKERIQL